MSSKVVHGPKLFSGSKVHDSVLPRHQVWFSSFDKSFPASRKPSSSLTFSVTSRRFENADMSCISDENNNSPSKFTNNDSVDGNCNICNNSKEYVNVIDLSIDVSSIPGQTSKMNKQAVSSFKPESLFSTCSPNEESRVQRGFKHLYCNPFLEDEGYEDYGSSHQTSATNRHNKSKVDQIGPLAMCRDERVNDDHNKISQNGSMLVVNKSYVGCNNNCENAVGTNHNILASDNNNKWEVGDSIQQKKDKVVSRSLSNESMKKTTKSNRDKINKMVKQGARNYPAYLKLIYTGDSEHSSDDDTANHRNSPNENQSANSKDPSKDRPVDDEENRATPRGIYDRISLFIDDDDDEEEENSTSDKAEKLDRKMLPGKEDKSWGGETLAGNNDVMINDDGARNNSTDGPGPNPSEGPHRKNNDFEAKDVDDDDDDDNEVGCLANDNAVSLSNAVEYALKRRLTNGDDDSDNYVLNEEEEEDDYDDEDDAEEDDEDEDDDDEEDGVLLKSKSSSLQMIKRGRFIDGGNGGRHGNGSDDDRNRDEDEDDDDGNEELNRIDAIDKGLFYCSQHQLCNRHRQHLIHHLYLYLAHLFSSATLLMFSE